MGFLSDALKFTGLKGPDQHNADMGAGLQEYLDALKQYESSIGDISQIGQSGQMSPMRQKLESQIMEQLAQLDNNAAGRKQQFMSDMGRGFQTDTQNLARAKGGTGSMIQAMTPSGQMYDAQARERARGLLGLQDQALQHIGQLQGMQGNFYNQDVNKQSLLANARGNLASAKLGRQGQLLAGEQTRADNAWNRDQEQYNRIGNTIGGIAKGYGMFSGKKA